MKKQIIKQITPYALALSLTLAGSLGLGSCSKEGVSLLKDEEVSLPKEGMPAGITTGIELEIPVDDPEVGNAARGGQLFEYDLSAHNTYLKPTSTLKAGDQVPVVAYLRRKQMSASVSSMRIAENWTVKVGSNGKKYLSFSKEKMTLPSGWDLNNLSGNEYYLMAMIGGERTGDKVSVSGKDVAGDLVQAGSKIKLPGIFLAEWTKLSAKGTTLTRDPKEGVKSFAPQGIILVLKARNELRSEVNLRGFRISSNVFDFSGSYNNLEKVSVGTSPIFTPEDRHSMDYLVDASKPGYTLSYNATSSYLVCWVIPRGSRGIWQPKYSSLSTPFTKVSALIKGTYWGNNVGKAPNGVHTDRSLLAMSGSTTSTGPDTWKGGYFYGFKDVVIKRRKQCLPIEAFYFKNEISGIPDWWSPYGRSQPLIYGKVADYISRMAQDNDKRSYHTPSVKEWRALFPPLQGAKKTGNSSEKPVIPVTFFKPGLHGDQPETITAWGTTSNYTADYNNMGNGTTYAIRFKGGNGNKYLAAYRYEGRTNKFGDYSEYEHVKVTVRELGPNRTNITLDRISNDDYWNSEPDVDQCQVVRYIPKGYYWSTDVQSRTKQNVATCLAPGFSTVPYFEYAFFCDDHSFHSAGTGNNNTLFVFGVTSERE